MKIGKNKLYINWIDYGKKKAANSGLLTKKEYIQSIPYWRYYVKVKTKDGMVITTHKSFHTYSYEELLQHVRGLGDLKNYYPEQWPYIVAYPRKYER